MEQKLTVTQLVMKVPACYETQRFITVFTTVRHWSLSWTTCNQSIPSQPYFPKIHSNIISHQRLGVSSLQVSLPKFYIRFSFPHTCRVPHQSDCDLFRWKVRFAMTVCRKNPETFWYVVGSFCKLSSTGFWITISFPAAPSISFELPFRLPFRARFSFKNPSILIYLWGTECHPISSPHFQFVLDSSQRAGCQNTESANGSPISADSH